MEAPVRATALRSARVRGPSTRYWVVMSALIAPGFGSAETGLVTMANSPIATVTARAMIRRRDDRRGTGVRKGMQNLLGVRRFPLCTAHCTTPYMVISISITLRSIPT